MEIMVFISYSWDNEVHSEWVNRIAHILYRTGIKVLIDQIQVQYGRSLQDFMFNGINESRWVICVISDSYIRKMNDNTTGVGKENEIIRNKLNSEFIIPVLKNNNQHTVPEIFDGKFYLDFDNYEEKAQIQKLLKRLYGIDKEVEPTVVENPFSKDVANELILDAEIAKSTYINPALKGEVIFDYSNNDGKYTIGSGKYSFTTRWSKASDISIHAYKDSLIGGKIARIKGINSMTEFNSSKDLDFTSRHRTVSAGDAVVWINSFGNMAITRIIRIVDDTRNGIIDSLEFEFEIFDKPR